MVLPVVVSGAVSRVEVLRSSGEGRVDGESVVRAAGVELVVVGHDGVDLGALLELEGGFEVDGVEGPNGRRLDAGCALKRW